MDDIQENRDRQSAEIVLLESMYPSEFAWRSDPSADLTAPDSQDPAFSLSLHSLYTLEITLPRTYPSRAKPNIYLSCAGTVSTARRKEARAMLAAILGELEPGVEVLDLLVTGFADRVSELTGPETAASSHPESGSAGGSERMGGKDPGQAKERIKRVVIWSHHLLATSKRRDIITWSRELRLSGYSRPGYPGAVFVEGEEGDVDEFLRRLKALRWQALQVRAEEVGEERVCGTGEGVTEVEGLGEVTEGLRGAGHGVAEMFLEGMKIAH